MAQLENVMNVSAIFNSINTNAQSTVVVELGNMTLIKSADKDIWTDGELTYTVTLENIETAGNISSIVFTDQIDITKSQLITTSVTLDGNELVIDTDFTYNPITGDFRIELDDELVPGAKVTITFRVRKV